MTIKIMHIYNDYYPPIEGGIEKHINIVCEGLQDKFQMSVLVAGRSRKRSTDKINDIEIIKIPELFRVQSAPVCPSMFAWIRNIGADILHFHLPCPTAVGSYFLSGAKGKVVVTYHSDIVRQKWALGLYGPLLHKFLARADQIIATSPNYISSSAFLQPVKEKCTVIPHGVDINKFTSALPSLPEKYGIKTGEKILLFVGKLRYYKGLDYLIKAMQNINATLLIIGTGNEEQRLKQLVTELELQNKVVFLGFVPDEKLPDYYHACDIFVLPSIFRSEAFGIVQLEAMASRKPVISTNLPSGVPWVNQNGKTGIIIPPKNSTALTDAANKLLANKNLREEYGKNARIRVEKEFRRELMLKRIADVYHTL